MELALAGAGGADPCVGAGVSALRRHDQKDRRREQLDGRGCGEMGFPHVLSCFAAFPALPVGAGVRRSKPTCFLLTAKRTEPRPPISGRELRKCVCTPL